MSQSILTQTTHDDKLSVDLESHEIREIISRESKLSKFFIDHDMPTADAILAAWQISERNS